ncbi:hypothetical protein [Prescottella equi]|uniref:hypothetical protein n=1 Tax=Rhodococcus hoagii TaxID=43767 RepID=UPI000A106A0D|nr:hypothetical protein [Prescottella equi]ORL11630.1 hypothetical protein A6I85_17065 [Prescottella equi]
MSTELPEPSRCRSCRAEIHWGKTPAGKHLPVDVTPAKSGTVALDVHGGVLYAGVLVGAQLAAVRRSTRPLYEPHWVNCPDAKAWRNR